LPNTGPNTTLTEIRAYWQVEKHLHGSLDVTFREDQSRIRQENAAINYSWMRKFALGLLKKDTSVKMSIRRKQRKALVDPSYLTTVVKEN
ncbi:transposase, partial [Facilibium subflavum]|uniref:transposase n=1 Tax=Facilibium subflavum TaxID=2219058 RepID=UPI0013C30ED6